MLNTPIKRETVKAVGTVGAAVAGGPIAVVLAASLGVAVEALGYLGEKRTKELFNTPELLNSTIAEIKKSDDFAGFVYDIWMKHNFESSETRRKRLKEILVRAVGSKSKDFENFTRLITAAQQINDLQVRILDIYYKHITTEEAAKDARSARLEGRRGSGHKINALQLAKALHKEDVTFPRDGGDSLTPILNQLCYLGLISTFTAMDGEYYMPTTFGRIFLEYVKS